VRRERVSAADMTTRTSLCGVAFLVVAALATLCLPCRGDDVDTTLGHLRRGVNILGYDGLWKGEIDNPFRMSDLERIHKAGFDHVRVNFFGLRYMNEAGVLDEAVLDRLDGVLDRAAKENLWVVLDQHDNDRCDGAPETCKEALVSFWRQLARRYAARRPTVAFEILNEPGWKMTYDQWNAVVSAVHSEIRRADPQRLIVVAALNNGEPSAVEHLDLPRSDSRLIVTIHYYGPMQFTHQGARWNKDFADLANIAWGADASRQKVVDDFAPVAAWSKRENRPIYLGEFGVIDGAPPKSRVAWTRHVARTAEAFGWGWAHWQFDHEFSLTDPVTREWKTPLLEPLMK
jgi:endoglucanase